MASEPQPDFHKDLTSISSLLNSNHHDKERIRAIPLNLSVWMAICVSRERHSPPLIAYLMCFRFLYLQEELAEDLYVAVRFLSLNGSWGSVSH